MESNNQQNLYFALTYSFIRKWSKCADARLILAFLLHTWANTRFWYMYLSHMLKNPPLNVHAFLSSAARCLIIGLKLHLFPYLVYARSKGSDETVQTHSLVRVFATRRCDKYHNHVYFSAFATPQLVPLSLRLLHWPRQWSSVCIR